MVAAPLHRAWDGPADAGPLISTSLYPGARTATAPSQAMRYGDGGQCRDSHLLAPAWRGGGLTPSHLRLPVEADRRTGKDAGDVKRWRREWIPPAQPRLPPNHRHEAATTGLREDSTPPALGRRRHETVRAMSPSPWEMGARGRAGFFNRVVSPSRGNCN